MFVITQTLHYSLQELKHYTKDHKNINSLRENKGLNIQNALRYLSLPIIITCNNFETHENVRDNS